MLASSGTGETGEDSEIWSSGRTRLCVRDSSLVEGGEGSGEMVVGDDTRRGRS